MDFSRDYYRTSQQQQQRQHQQRYQHAASTDDVKNSDNQSRYNIDNNSRYNDSNRYGSYQYNHTSRDQWNSHEYMGQKEDSMRDCQYRYNSCPPRRASTSDSYENYGERQTSGYDYYQRRSSFVTTNQTTPPQASNGRNYHERCRNQDGHTVDQHSHQHHSERQNDGRIDNRSYDYNYSGYNYDNNKQSVDIAVDRQRNYSEIPSLVESETSSDNSFSEDKSDGETSSRKDLSKDNSTNNQDDCNDDNDNNRKLPPRTKSNESFYQEWNSRDNNRKNNISCDIDSKSSSSRTGITPPLRNIVRNQLSFKKTSGQQTIEIFPGVYKRLRGANETWNAVMNDFYMPNQCMECDRTIFCIQDASYILCPVCRVISPVSFEVENSDGGVGLGFTMEELANWQEKVCG